MNQAQRHERAVTRSAPHLTKALARIIDHNVTPKDAGHAMLLFAAGVLANEMIEGEAKGSILYARDQLYAWLTDLAERADTASPDGRKG